MIRKQICREGQALLAADIADHGLPAVKPDAESKLAAGARYSKH
jgi:hypothetical protein